MSNRLIKAKDPTGWRLPASKLETALAEAVRNHIQDRIQNHDLLKSDSAHGLEELHRQIKLKHFDQTAVLSLVQRVEIEMQQVQISLSKSQLADSFAIKENVINADALIFGNAFTFSRRSQGAKIIIGETQSEPNHDLLIRLKEARTWIEEIKRGQSIAQIAEAENRPADQIRKRIRLGLLSLTVQSRILSGDHPSNWTPTMFVQSQIPLRWSDQEQMFLGSVMKA